ncbi:hypothetical protein Dform_01637 [Dehalogenimonas formicexedens]|uniref:Uncharacterized protein n=1 Tax=Dehalogenimonas formicexedens TaxID=1839801 RepID=A0A1P8F929_9CHLR|nr:hypothetical protein [Dehalogenimonas formicexedens]APV44958.1 hypothetical protein Dform_01637 [Dehalogenimonas formicexedens]
MDKVKKALADYIAVLAKCSIETRIQEDQGLYQFHLAQAALMFLAIEKDGSIDKLKQITGMVNQVYQLNPLHGLAGTVATEAFKIFTNLVQSG